MASGDLERVALMLVADGKGILAADETIPTLTRRFDTLGIKSTEQSRRTYREMLFTSPGAAEFISGVIMYDETIRQKSSRGLPLAEALAIQGVHTGAKPLAGYPDEIVTEGLDGLRDRLSEYRSIGARFAKWRAVIRITDSLPTSACVNANAQALARYAALCQEQETRTNRRTGSAYGWVAPDRTVRRGHRGRPSCAVQRTLRAGCRARGDATQAQHGRRGQDVHFPALCGGGRDVDIALLASTRACRGYWHRVPVGRAKRTACDYTSERWLPGPKPWKISFSYGRALQDPALDLGMAWTRIWRLARVPSIAAPVATVQRAWGNTPMRWSWSR